MSNLKANRGIEGTAALEAVLYTIFMLIPVLLIGRGITATSIGAIDAAASSRYVSMSESVDEERYEDRENTRVGYAKTKRYDTNHNKKIISNFIANYPQIQDPVDASTTPAEGKKFTSPPP